MSASEIAAARRQLRARIEAILAADELAAHDAYQARVQAALDRRDPAPIAPAPAEQAALDKIAHDTEAAALDNTPRWRVLTHITLPSLKRAIVLVALIEVIRQFQVFPQIMLMTNGGPNNTTRPIVQFIYEQAFMQLSLGYATAASQVLLAVMLVGVSVQMWLERREAAQGARR